MSLLSSELAAVRGELTRVDAKSATLAGLAGVGLAFLVTQTGHGPLAARLALAAAGTVLAAATELLLMVLRPRLGSTGFRRYAAMAPAEIRALFAAAVIVNGPDDRAGRLPSGLVDGIEADDLQVLSDIVNRKYRALRTSVDLARVLVAGVPVVLWTAVIW